MLDPHTQMRNDGQQTGGDTLGPAEKSRREDEICVQCTEKVCAHMVERRTSFRGKKFQILLKENPL